MQDIFRKYPHSYEGIIPALCANLDELDEPEAKASLIWIIGEYAEKIENADELLGHFLDTFKEESYQVSRSAARLRGAADNSAGAAADPYGYCEAVLEEARRVAGDRSEGATGGDEGLRQCGRTRSSVHLLAIAFVRPSSSEGELPGCKRCDC